MALPTQADGNTLVQVLPAQHVTEPGLGSFHPYEVFGVPPALAQVLLGQKKVRVLATLAEATPKPEPPAEEPAPEVVVTPEGDVDVAGLPRQPNGLVLIKASRKIIAAGMLINAGECAGFSPQIAAELIRDGYGVPADAPPAKPVEAPPAPRVLVRLIKSIPGYTRGERVAFLSDEAASLVGTGAAEFTE